MNKSDAILQEVKKMVIGKDEILKKILMVMLAKGHILLEDIPGVGKTTIAVAFSKAMSLDSKRMQFTVDVLPSDVVGFASIDMNTGKEVLHKGAIFCNLFLADEINRTSSKTQAALLEVMEEGSVTIDGFYQEVTHPFIVIATQNPLGSAGTHLLPESQLDRFMIRTNIGYPAFNYEIDILKQKENNHLNIQPVVSKEEVIEMQRECEKIYLDQSIYEYIVRLIAATRTHTLIRQGASPRTGISLMNMAKASAYMDGRDYVVPKDITSIFHEVVGHRILLQHITTSDACRDILNDILTQVVQPGLEIG